MDERGRLNYVDERSEPANVAKRTGLESLQLAEMEDPDARAHMKPECKRWTITLPIRIERARVCRLRVDQG